MTKRSKNYQEAVKLLDRTKAYEPGEAIELTFDVGTKVERYQAVQVARTAPHDRFFSIVACQKLPGRG